MKMIDEIDVLISQTVRETADEAANSSSSEDASIGENPLLLQKRELEDRLKTVQDDYIKEMMLFSSIQEGEDEDAK